MIGLSKAAKATKESFIMGLVEVAARPGMVSFATGLPDNSLFDPEAVRRATESVLDEDPCGMLQYDASTGFRPLREKIADRCRKVLGFETSWENVLMTSGSQCCFDMMGKMFLDPGDAMVVENPGYLGAIQAYSAYSPRFVGLDIDEGGIDPSALSDAVGSGAKLFYSVPNHQNPTGYSYSEDVRRDVAGIIDGSGCMMVEDDAYGELGYKGRAGRTMRSMAPENVVVTGSFSKTISPGMRVGWMVVPDWLREQAGRTLEATCLQSNTFCQRIIDRFLDQNDYDSYLVGLRKGYEAKKRMFLDAMEDELPDSLNWNDPDGGMFVWLRTPEGTDSTKLFELCVDRGLVMMPGKPFHTEGGANTLRLNFATPDEEQIRKGMSILGRACRDLGYN